MAPIDRLWLLGCLIVLACDSLAIKPRISYKEAELAMKNEPEDLLLEELVRTWKWNMQQQQQQHPYQLSFDDDDLFNDYEEAVQYRPMVATKGKQQLSDRHFAYRPNEAGFRGSNGVRRPVEKDPIDLLPPTQLGTMDPPRVLPNNDVRLAGQKEGIFDEDVQQVRAQEEPISKFQSETQATKAHPPGEADVEEPTSMTREPVAHAILSPVEKAAHRHDSLADIYLTALVAGCTASVVAALLALGVCFYRWQRRAKSAQDVEYPAYGITGPGPSSGKSSLKSSPTSSTPIGIGGWSGNKSPKIAATGDKKLAHSAHMFHFQHQKQQVIAMESHSACERRGSNSGGESDEDNEEGDYTVYECPGLAPTGEMEVKNPLFLDDPTPASPALKRQSE